MSGRWRRFVLTLAALVGLPLMLAAAVLAAAVLFEWSVEATRWRDAAAGHASAALGRPVVLQGALGLTLGREVVLKSGGLRVLNPPGFSGPEFLTAGSLSVRFGLLDAVPDILRGRFQLRGVDASDVRLALEQAGDGRANWVFQRRSDAAPAAAAFDFGPVTLKGLSISHLDARSAVRRSVELDLLTASIGSDAPVQVALRGRAGPQQTFKLRLEGGPLALMQDGARPWPFTLTFSGAGAWLQARGDVGAGRARFDFESGADDLAALASLLGTTLSPVGSATLQGAAVLAAEGATLTALQGRLGESDMSGHLALALGGARPRLEGALNIDAFDLSPFLGHDWRTPDEQAPANTPAMPAPALRDLFTADVAVDLGVGQLTGLPVELRDARLELRADSRGLRMPMAARVAGVPSTGVLELDTSPAVPRLMLSLDAKNIVFSALAGDFPSAGAMPGRMGRLGLRAAGSGNTLGALWRDLDLSLAVADMQATLPDAVGTRPVTFTLNSLNLSMPAGERLRGSARGTLLGERATLVLSGGTLDELLRGSRLPFKAELAAAPATLRVEGVFAQHEEAGGSSLNFALSAARSGDLARWLGGGADASTAPGLPVALNGRLALAGTAWQRAETTLRLGRSEVTVDARRPAAGGKPVTVASVRGAFVDLQELLSLRSGAGPGLDTPLLSAPIEFADADIDVRLDRVALGSTELGALGLDARLREGHLPPSRLNGRLAGAPFSGTVGVDLRSPSPEARLELATGRIDVGTLLRGLRATDAIDGHADALQLSLQLKGNTQRQLAAQAAAELRLTGGSLSLQAATKQVLVGIEFKEAVVGASAGGPLLASLDGTLSQAPVRIDVASGTLADLARAAGRLPFTLLARTEGMAQTRLALDGDLALPLGSDAQLNFELGGERLDALSGLARVELPAWGPWSLRSPLHLTPDGFELRALQLRVGESRLGGSAKLDLSGLRPRLDLRVAAPLIQLDDFPLPQRLADAPEAPPAAGSTDALRVAASRLAGRADQVLSAGFLRRFDATIDVDAQEVMSGADRLAKGSLHLTLQDGRLNLDPAVLSLPGGRMRLAVSYDLKGSEVDVAVGAQVERFDYGIIARRLGRVEDVSGLFSLNLELKGKAPTLASIMHKANGKVDLAVWPKDLRLGVFNLWSVNLVLNLLPLIDPGGAPRVNCVVGRFDLQDGRLSDDKFLIDTTRVRVLGAGQADLASEELAFVFRPRAKGLAVFRLQTPLRVSGTLTDQRFGLDRRDVVESTLRMIASPILLPIDWLVNGPLPRDGADVCTDPLRAASASH